MPPCFNRPSGPASMSLFTPTPPPMRSECASVSAFLRRDRAIHRTPLCGTTFSAHRTASTHLPLSVYAPVVRCYCREPLSFAQRETPSAELRALSPCCAALVAASSRGKLPRLLAGRHRRTRPATATQHFLVGGACRTTRALLCPGDLMTLSCGARRWQRRRRRRQAR